MNIPIIGKIGMFFLGKTFVASHLFMKALVGQIRTACPLFLTQSTEVHGRLHLCELRILLSRGNSGTKTTYNLYVH